VTLTPLAAATGIETWPTARGVIALDRPLVLGILNVTPDSFSDGGRWLDPDAALAHAEEMVAEGADLLDIGAESTRPGRPAPVSAEEEWRRLGPVLEGLARRLPGVPVSVDTVKGTTARRALEAGAWIINDVTGLRHDPAVADACAAHGAGLVVMHSRGDLPDLATYTHATYGALMTEIADELGGMIRTAEGRGVAPARIAVDPGFGFGKRPEHNLRLLDQLAALRALGRPIVVGPSRKRFLGVVTGRDAAERDAATAAACVLAWERGAHIFRVHAVRGTRDALRVAHAVRTA
jgi:dihydropteroate synthase